MATRALRCGRSTKSANPLTRGEHPTGTGVLTPVGDSNDYMHTCLCKCAFIQEEILEIKSCSGCGRDGRWLSSPVRDPLVTSL